MRKWADTRGGGGPFPNAGPSAPISKEQAIDRLHQHTLSCPSCSVVRLISADLRCSMTHCSGSSIVLKEMWCMRGLQLCQIQIDSLSAFHARHACNALNVGVMAGHEMSAMSLIGLELN